MIGLGRMGQNMCRRLIRNNHEVFVYDLDKITIESLRQIGAKPTNSIDHLIQSLKKPSTIWIMVPSGKETEKVVNKLINLLDKGDYIIDGGNSYYKDSIRRNNHAEKNKINFLDCGTSGGIWGLKNGYCLTIGGSIKAYNQNLPIFKSLSPKISDGNLYVGKSGSGHYVKMIHNGIEYGMMQAIAEGFELLSTKKDFNLDLYSISKNWEQGSVIKSWLLELITSELENESSISELSSYVEDSGEGRWTLNEAVELGIPIPVISSSLFARFRSRQKEPLSGKILSAMRRGFGGHKVEKL
tara:strand:- start:1721 stop:2614 length:894 start_codon:yes stop_codon:yes gene_type:complete